MSISPPSSIESELAAYLASEPDATSDPYPLFSEIRTASPVYFHEHGHAYFVCSHALVKASLSDHSRLSNRGYADGSRAQAARAALAPDDRLLLDDVNRFELLMVSRSDGDQHQRLRRIAHRAFTPRRVGRLGERIREFTEQLLNELERGSASVDGTVDLMAGLAKRLPTMVIAEMLDVPQSDRGRIRTWADTISQNRGGHNARALRGAHGAIAEFRAYLGEMIVEAREGGTGQELVSTLLEAHDGERLNEEELLAMFVVLLFAGTETTTNLIAIGVWALLQERDQWEALAGDPTRAPGAVEELLRFVSPVQYLMRVALTDMQIGEVSVHRGDSVLLSLAAANHDPNVFTDPDRLDISRNAGRHVALAFGPHFCLGASLARLEAQVVLESLAARYPNLAPGGDALAFAGNAMLRTVESVPVRLAA